MSTEPSRELAILLLKQAPAYIDAGDSTAIVVIYDDTRPPDTSVPADNMAKLVTMTIPKPCLKEELSDGVELKPTLAATVIKTGTATWARMFNGNGQVVFDFTVGVDIFLDNADLVLGGTEKLSSIALRVPT